MPPPPPPPPPQRQRAQVGRSEMAAQDRGRRRRRPQLNHKSEAENSPERLVKGATLRGPRGPKRALAPLKPAAALLLLVAFVQRDSTCLKISSIGVPAAVWNGSQVTFVCNYELAPDDQLYSVKWYKNYVEFYRFQPQAAGAAGEERALEAQQVGQNLNLNQPTGGARHEFELEGINLELAKSNATHVHLRQVSLASEATFKCEVSADSPTFATVSAERQMKIFVLPKQKLALVDNSGSSASNAGPNSSLAGQPPPQQDNSAAAARLQNNGQPRQLIYQLNDLVNFTCVAGPSRPGARLSWLLNDEPLEAPAGANNNKSAAPLKLQALDISDELRTLPNELVEARSTLTLRLQASHMKLLRKQAAGLLGQSRSQAGPGGQAAGAILPIKLSCLARMSVSFARETSVLVASGQPAPVQIKRRGGQQAALPVAAPWQEEGAAAAGSEQEGNQEDSTLDGARARRRNNNNNIADADFRWPSSGGEQAASAAREQRFRPHEGAALADVWLAPNLEATGSGETEAATGGGRRGRPRQGGALVWTQRQLRAQAEHIERLIRRWRPNELEAPHIEARSLGRRQARPGGQASTGAPPSGGGGGGGGMDAATEGAPGGGGGDDAADDDEEAAAAAASDDEPAGSSPSLVIPGGQFMPADLDELAPAPRNSYQLDELVNFTCHSMMAGGQARGSNPLYSVQVKWFINGQELGAGSRVNAYDGQRFYLRAAGEAGAAGAAALPLVNQTAALVAERAPARSNWLLVEFSASLLQAKELSLKCRTIVEQPLIEYESAQILSLATSPFIQAHPHAHEPRRPSSFSLRPPRLQAGVGLANYDYSQPAAGGQQQQQQHRNNVIRMRQSQQARSQAPPTPTADLLVPLALLAGALLALRAAAPATRRPAGA